MRIGVAMFQKMCLKMRCKLLGGFSVCEQIIKIGWGDCVWWTSTRKRKSVKKYNCSNFQTIGEWEQRKIRNTFSVNDLRCHVVLLEQQRDSNPDLCYAVAVLHPLSYQASQGAGFKTRLGLKNSGISFAIVQVHNMTADIINMFPSAVQMRFHQLKRS